MGFNYWPFVERKRGEGRRLLHRLSARAALVVTDDYPCFIVPAQAQVLARKVEVPVFAVDSNSGCLAAPGLGPAAKSLTGAAVAASPGLHVP